MATTETDSLWLQKSITLPDPLPDVTGTTPAPALRPVDTLAEQNDEKPSAQERDEEPQPQPAVPSVPSPSAANAGGELELTKMLLDTSHLLPGAAAQRSSLARFSTSRVSLSNSAFISAQEYDDLRARYSQAKRELLNVSDIQKDLDFARFELTRTQEELKLVLKSTSGLKQDLEEAQERADRAVKAKTAMDAKCLEEVSLRQKEIDFLKAQIADLRSENAQRLQQLTAQQESESQSRIAVMRDELAALSEEAQSMQETIEGLSSENTRVQAAYDAALAELESAQSLAAERERKISQQMDELRMSDESGRKMTDQLRQEQEEAVRSQRELADRRVEQLKVSKDARIAEVTEELTEANEKRRALADELTALRASHAQLSDEVKRVSADRAKDLRRLAEEQSLALAEKDLQLESALRDANGGRAAQQEESLKLRRQLDRATEELSTVAAVLAQREKQLAEAERGLSKVSDRVTVLEQENTRLESDADLNQAAVSEAEDRIRRLNEQKDALEDSFTADLRAAKERVRSLESSLMSAREELATLRREHTTSSEDVRAAMKELRAQVETLHTENARLASDASAKKSADVEAEELRKHLAAEKQKTDGLTAELSAAMNRCGLLEKRLDEELRRGISRAVAASGSTASARASPVPVPTSGVKPPLHQTPSALRVRSASSANTRVQGSSSSLKRARTEDARVFAISGFDGVELLSAIKQLPNVAIAESKSNMPVPANLTHLITNGQLTIKLLTALVRGCWALPEAYVTESLSQQRWLDERDFGFQHEDPPLLKRRVSFTDDFTSCKHYSTACLLLREGGATVVDSSSADDADVVLCTNHELAEHESNGMSWEKMVELIYPQRIE